MRCALVAAVLLVACGKSEPPPCTKVVDHMLEVTRLKSPGHETEQLGSRTAMLEHCDKRLTAEERRCLLAAKDLDAIGKCRSKPKPAS